MGALDDRPSIPQLMKSKSHPERSRYRIGRMPGEEKLIAERLARFQGSANWWSLSPADAFKPKA